MKLFTWSRLCRFSLAIGSETDTSFRYRLYLLTPKIGVIFQGRRKLRTPPFQFGEGLGAHQEPNLLTKRVPTFLKFMLTSSKRVRVAIRRGLRLFPGNFFELIREQRHFLPHFLVPLLC